MPRLGEVLLAIGAVVGVVAVVGLVVGFEPSNLPPALLNIAIYKLTFGAAAGLLAAGAVVRRHAKRHEGPDHDRTAGRLSADGPGNSAKGPRIPRCAASRTRAPASTSRPVADHSAA